MSGQRSPSRLHSWPSWKTKNVSSFSRKLQEQTSTKNVVICLLTFWRIPVRWLCHTLLCHIRDNLCNFASGEAGEGWRSSWVHWRASEPAWWGEGGAQGIPTAWQKPKSSRVHHPWAPAYWNKQQTPNGRLPFLLIMVDVSRNTIGWKPPWGRANAKQRGPCPRRRRPPCPCQQGRLIALGYSRVVGTDLSRNVRAVLSKPRFSVSRPLRPTWMRKEANSSRRSGGGDKVFPAVYAMMESDTTQDTCWAWRKRTIRQEKSQCYSQGLFWNGGILVWKDGT